VGVGSALVDILVNEDDAFIKKLDAPKGGMIHVDSEFIEQALSQTDSTPEIVPGGSACNTIIGIGNLDGKGRFVGKRGEDEFGRMFEEYLQKNRIDPKLVCSSTPNGRLLSVITPDAQRTMLTFLGAASESKPDEITTDCFKDAEIVHIEGYLLFTKDYLMAALNAAKEAGAKISMDLSSYTVVEASKDILDDIVKDYVDILIANEDEASAFTGHTDENNAIKSLSERADIAVLKVGARGSFISQSNQIIKVDPQGAGDIVDTTGAGDLWAAGFLYGLVNGLPLEQCGKLASACGYEVCRVVGASIPEDGWQRIKKHHALA
jgi:sugar/nucleoside kinase (ribokinase family)